MDTTKVLNLKGVKQLDLSYACWSKHCQKTPYSKIALRTKLVGENITPDFEGSSSRTLLPKYALYLQCIEKIMIEQPLDHYWAIAFPNEGILI